MNPRRNTTVNSEEGLRAIRDTLGLPTPSPKKQFTKKSDDEDVKEIFKKSIEAIRRDFIEGQCYQITETKSETNKSYWDTPTLRYEGKHGIHHTFREVTGKWLVTYTDAQLIGKHIKQVEGTK